MTEGLVAPLSEALLAAPEINVPVHRFRFSLRFSPFSFPWGLKAVSS